MTKRIQNTMTHVFNLKKCVIFLILLSLLTVWISYTTFFHGHFTPISIWRTSTFRKNETFSNWIVVTTNVQPTYAMKYMSNLPEWKLLVVENSNTPKDWKLTNCTYLSLTEQQHVYISKLIPTESYSRKIIGYLYAISNGAETIYDLDDTIQLLTDLDDLVNPESFEYGLQYNGRVIFNPFKHFGQSTIWPRGFPLNKISENGTNSYFVSDFKKPSILQILSNGDPDIDSVFRRTLKSTIKALNISFDSAKPPVVIPPLVFTAINSQNTLFRYKALWAMVLPVTPSHQHSDVIRGYWAQRLLWEIGGSVGCYPPNTYQIRNSRSYALIEDSKGSYFDPNKLVDFLIQWKCPVERTFFQCVSLLSEKLAEDGYWQQHDHLLVKAWIHELKDSSYKEPKRKPFTHQNITNHTNSVIYEPVESANPKIRQQSKWNHVLGMTSFCKDTSYQIKSTSLASVTSPDILLVVVFNFPFYDNIPYLQLMYGVTFAHIVYCGPNIERFLNASKHFTNKVTFVESVVDEGYCAYTCLSAAMKMNFDVQGYLFIGDDTLLNSWNIHKFPLDMIWFRSDIIRLYKGKKSSVYWWQTHVGQNAMNKVWTLMHNLSTENGDLKPVVDKFVHTLLANNASKDGAMAGWSDILYIPSKYKKDTIFFLDLFAECKVFLEIAIATLVSGLEDKNNFINLEGQYLWYDGKRNKIPELFKPNDTYLHPVKLSHIKTKLKKFFCKTYFPLTLNDPRT
ncbi:uncharacterized protein LOC126818313 [Patella vulgata]|uniref:uncharacterized protein LOC126818313 n=1 Tax=Patella vulgata TaxID=6465 RepID=UPI0024A84595|nr:uncharacterized protein LOC126818313 [Patella vulgata]